MMFISKKHRIVAAGPVHLVNCGMLGYMYLRAALVLTKAGSYRMEMEELDENGKHKDFDLTAGVDLQSFPNDGTMRNNPAIVFSKHVADMAASYPMLAHS